VSAPPTPKQEKAQANGAFELKPGQKVSHTVFGVGVVLSAKPEGEDLQVAVAFPMHGVKKLMQSFANLKKV
jgi:DNA helicase-2/ATP-dependent DNA helicase PcrA